MARRWHLFYFSGGNKSDSRHGTRADGRARRRIAGMEGDGIGKGGRNALHEEAFNRDEAFTKRVNFKEEA